MSVLIGLDVGWSDVRRTCGLAISGAPFSESGTVTFGNVSSVALYRRDVARALRTVVLPALQRGARVLLVTDAIVTAQRVPSVNRTVDSRCSSGGFFRRTQSYPATQETGRLLSSTLHDILDELLRGSAWGWTAWLGDGAPPSQGLVVTETNPTTSMAVSLSMADVDGLPTRKRPRRLADGTRIRAKSDWYWRSGAGRITADSLAVVGVQREEHHERVAALWCLGLARRVEEGRAVLVGDSGGTYVVGSVHPDWRSDLERVGVRWGTLSSEAVELSAPQSSPDELRADSADGYSDSDAVEDDGADEDGLRGNDVRVYFNDLGGLTRKANPWLGTVDFPCRLATKGRVTAEFTVIPFAPPNHTSQFKVTPTIATLISPWGGPSILSSERSFALDATVLGSTEG